MIANNTFETDGKPADTQRSAGCAPMSGSALRYADGSPVNAGDVVKINNATCTVLRILAGSDGNPWIVACHIEGCGEIEHGVFAATFQKHSPQNAIALAPASK